MCRCFILSILFMSGFLFGSALDLGISHLSRGVSSSGGGEYTRMEYALAMRCLRATEVDTSQSALYSGAESEDLSDVLLRLWGGGSMGSDCLGIVNEDGGWSVESGGLSEPGATMLGVGYMLDMSGGEHGGYASKGLDYLLESCCRESDIGSFSFDMSGTGAGRYEFFVLMCQLYREGLLWSRSLEESLFEFGHRLRADLQSQPLRSVYEVSLYVRGACLLGRREGLSALVSYLLGSQGEDGSWDDAEHGGVVYATCAAVEALRAVGGDVCAVDAGVFWLQEDGLGEAVEVGSCEEATVLQVALGNAGDSYRTLSVYDGNGKKVFHQRESSGGGGFAIRFRGWVPGRYEVVVRQWSQAGSGLQGEWRHVFEVPGWQVVDELSVSDVGCGRIVRVGETVVVTPRVLLRVSGNIERKGVLSCCVRDSSGIVFHAFPEKEITCVSSAAGTEVLWDECALSFPHGGRYEVVAVLEVGGQRHEGRLWLHVRDGLLLYVENYLEPASLPTGIHRGKVRLCLSSEKSGGSEGVPFGIVGGRRFDIYDIDEDTCQDVCVDGIVDERGERVSRGWVVVRAEYGRCVGGTGVEVGDGALMTAHEVVDGRCKLAYYPGGLGLETVVPLKFFAGILVDGLVHRLESIGGVELRLRGGWYGGN